MNKSKKGSKGKPKYQKSKKDKLQEKDEVRKDPSCSYENDPLWYALTEQLLRQTDSMSFDSVIGLKPIIPCHAQDAATYYKYLTVGSIMQIELFPTIGYQGAPQAPYANRSAVGDASQRIYTILSAANGKTTKYLSEDPALVIIMLGNITSMSACFWRLVGVRNLFSARNRFVPNEIIKAMGFNPANFLRNISDAMERYNNLVARLNGISMFADIPYFTKCNELFSHVFYDKGSAMGQFYITKPAGWFRYTDGEIDPDTGFFTGNKLSYTTWDGLLEINDFLDIMEHQVDDMLKSELFNYVYSDVIREIRRNGGQTYQFNLIDESYYILPEFSEVFMTQIHNMNWGIINDLTGYEITDDVDNLDLKDNLDYSINPTNNEKFLIGDHVLDFPYTDDPDYKLIAEALAFKFMADNVITTGSAAGQIMSVAVPDHAVYKVKIIGCNGVTGAATETSLDYITDTATYTTASMLGLSSFDIKPIVVGVNGGNAHVIGELNYFTTLSATKLERIFRQAFIKLFSSESFNGNNSISTVAK